jgi:valyl-tRNA synthetase
MELSKRYDPSQVEEKIYRLWEAGDAFRASLAEGAEPFSIVIPPPNVTGRLHLGHALNNTLQDVLVRYRRMDGAAACWFPGTDHAGIATQNVVEKELAKDGLSRHEIGREAFVARVWDWKRKYGTEIIDQLKALGCSCDWSRLRFTLDEGLSQAVRLAFVNLYRDGLIYRGNYLINWCPRCETALSDIEVEHREVDGALYYVRYAVEGGGSLLIATTRPETMLGDTGVAVNPDDTRYAQLIGKTAILPLLDRRLPIVGASEVDPEFGTGVLKITPAHDPIDFEIGQRNGLPSINILNSDGTINENGGPYAGLERNAARQAVVAALEEKGVLEKTVPYRHAIGHCERCDTAVEPLLSTQWFVRMKPLAEPAIEAVRDGRLRFVPERWSKLYFDWLENIQDWCISRQLWWGHRIPVWYGPDDTPFGAMDEADAKAQARAHYGEDVALRQEEDVLDTWFSSSLWPFSVMGWPEETDDLRTFYPSSVLVTGFDILFFWVARMAMMGLHFTGKVPFPEVYITPLIVDEAGQKMSKSRGNSIDPMDIRESYGMDALRFALAQSTSKGRSMRLPQSLLDEARNFLNKIWNMSRFVLMNLGDDRPEPPEAPSALEDRFILSRLAQTVETVRANLESYNFNLAVEALYAFVWHEFCDWYLELAKIRLAAGRDEDAAGVLHHVLAESMKLLHPFIPFISEEIWQALGDGTSLLAKADFPQATARDPEAEAAMASLQALVGAVRTIRAEFNVPQGATLDVLVKTSSPEIAALIEDKAAALHALSGTQHWSVGPNLMPPDGSARQVLARADLFIPLTEWIDIDAERARLQSDLSQVTSDLERVEANLGNPAFLKKAPQSVVEKEERKKAEFAAKHQRLRANLAALED